MTERPTIPAVIYAAKSTEDTHGSIPTQIEDCRWMAEREGWQVVGEFSDEAFSAFSGNRGPDLERAKALAIATAAEGTTCALVAQDADRFARGAGDEPGAADHVGEVYFAMKRRGVELWTVRSGRLDLLRATIEGERSHDETERKAQATKAGLKRRKERGQPVGAVPLGYRVHSTVAEGGQILTSRVPDPGTVPVVREIFDRVERGESFGEVARALNAAGVVGRRGGPWVSRTVRTIAHNAAYAGGKNYPALIDPSRWARIHDSLERLDPAFLQRRRGGRKPADDSYILRGLVFCLNCDAPLYTRPQAVGRVYVCRNRREGTGLCAAPAIPADMIEGHVLRHLHVFIGSVEEWIDKQVQQRSGEQEARKATVERERAALDELNRERDRQLAEYRRMVADEDRLARYALEEVERVDGEREQQLRAIAQAEAVVAEWQGPPDMDAALDFYRGIVDLVEGRVRSARGAPELNRALHQVIAGLWAGIDDDRLHAGFSLRTPDEADREVHGLVHALAFDPDVIGRLVSFPTTEYPGNPKETDLVCASLATRAEPGHTPSCRSSRSSRRSAGSCSPQPARRGLAPLEV